MLRLKMIVLVCGGRDFENREWLYRILDTIHQERNITLVVHGGAVGADFLAGQWADDRFISKQVFKANWRVYGKQAGPIRNQRMIDEQRPDLVVAFPGGVGTADMTKRARASGICIYEAIKDSKNSKGFDV